MSPIDGAVVIVFNLVRDDVHTTDKKRLNRLGESEASENVVHCDGDVGAGATPTPDDGVLVTIHTRIKSGSGDDTGAATR